VLCLTPIGAFRRKDAIHERPARTPLRHHRQRQPHPPRAPRGLYYLPHHGLHRGREPRHPLGGGDGFRRRFRRDMPRRRHRLAPHRPARQLSRRARARHGPERLLHLRDRPRRRTLLANGPRGRLHLRHPFHRTQHTPGARVARERH